MVEAVRQRGLLPALRRAAQKVGETTRPAPPLFSAEAALAYYKYLPPLPTRADNAAPRISVLILTHNNRVVTQACLHNLFRNTTHPNLEVVVVDNASTDGTPEWLKFFSDSHPEMRLILNDENRGFSAGNNQAVSESTGEYLVFLNNDTLVPAGWLEGLLAHLRADPTAGLVGPVTNSTSNEARMYVDYTSPGEMEALAAHLRRTQAGRSFEIRMLALYCVMVRRAEFLAAGGLDERYGRGMFEDEDLALAYRQRGLRSICALDVFVHHFWRASFAQMQDEAYRELFNANRQKFEEKWGRSWTPYSYSSLFSGRTAGEMGRLTWRCNICGRTRRTPVTDLTRDAHTCVCGSSVRLRSIIHHLSMELFGKSYALPDFPARSELKGIGLSDTVFPRLLSRKLGYTNTFYDRDPRLDITLPPLPAREESLDFLISSEVFEHVAPPAQRAFESAYKMLKPGGAMILTVPYVLDGRTREHFPELYDYELVKGKAGYLLKNKTSEGGEQNFTELVFHGGPGSTLEMRVFSEEGLLDDVQRAGFSSVRLASEPVWEYGIYWMEPWSLPVVSKK